MCVIRDFNAIRCEEERDGIGNGNESREMENFDGFINQNNLLDISLRGRVFTWYRSDGTCKSKLDRALVNDE